MQEKKIEYIEINDLLLWEKNPRFGYYQSIKDNLNVNYFNDDNIIKNLVSNEFRIKSESDALEIFKELINSLIEDGFNDDKYIYVTKINEQNKKYLVVEGNRRVAAMKIINYIKKQQNSWIDWFEDNFTKKYYENIKSKLGNFDVWKIPCKILPNDINSINDVVYRSDIVNSRGKKYWPRIVRLTYVYHEYEEIRKTIIEEKEIVQKLAKIFDKTKKTIVLDLKSAMWVIYCLKEANIDKTKYINWEISPLENARNKIIDPYSGEEIGKLLDIQQTKDGKFFIGEKSKIKIKFSDCAHFLCDSLEKEMYTTREWKWEYISELVSFLYPDGKRKNSILSIPLKKLKKVLSDPLNLKNLNIDDVDENNVRIIDTNYCEIKDLMVKLGEKIRLLNTKKNNFLDSVEHQRESIENNCAIHFCAFITFLYHEIDNQKFIGEPSIENFPYARFSLIFRNVFTIIINLIFINENSRNIFIQKLQETGLELENIEITGKTSFINLVKQSDWTAPSQFSSFEKIANSIFYRCRKGGHVTGFFTNDDPNDKQKKIIKLLIDNFHILFNKAYEQIKQKLKITANEIDSTKFEFFACFLKDSKTYDFMCRNIHNDTYIVTTYSPSLTKSYKDIFVKISFYLKELNNFIQSLIK